MAKRKRSRRGQRLFILAAFVPICALAADLPVREITSLAARVGGTTPPAFQRGYMYFLDDGTVRLYTPQGHPAFVRVLNIPPGTTPSLDSLAVDSDGSVAVAVDYRTPSGFGGGIVFLDKNGSQTAFIDTGLYMPSNLSYGEDHSLWALGWQRDPVRTETSDRQDYPMVRRYAADHREAGRYLSRSVFPKGLDPGMPSRWRERIMVSHDKVGLLAYSGRVGSSMEWVELDLRGNLIRRVPMTDVDTANDGAAFTSDGRLYWKDQHSDRLTVLSTTTPDWQDAGPSPARWLMGADADLLVFSPGGLGPVDLQWFAQPASQGP